MPDVGDPAQARVAQRTRPIGDANVVDGRPPGTLAVWPALTALIAFCTLWRLPGLADPPWLNDEGVYASVGAALLRGEALYRQVWENKPPGLYLLNALAERAAGTDHVLFAMRLAALASVVITQSAVYSLLRTQRSHATALLGAAFIGILVDLPLIDGLQANAEIFVIAGTSVGMTLVWRGLGESESSHLWPRYLAAGCALGIALILKLVAGADLVAAIVTVLLWPGTANEQRRRAIGALIAGALIPLSCCALWLGTRGLLGEALYATVGYNTGYVSTGQSQHPAVVTMIEAAALAATTVLAAALYRRRMTTGTAVPVGAFACGWLALSTAGACASGRLYSHYFLQACPAVAVCAALAVDALAVRASREAVDSILLRTSRRDALVRRALRALLVVWALSVPIASWVATAREPAGAAPGSDTVAYYGHFWRYLTGNLTDAQYGNEVDPRVERNVATAAYLKSHPSAPGTLYVWGNAPWIYYLSGYLHAARFLSAYYNPPIPAGIGQTVEQLRRNPPAYIVVIEPATPAIAQLAAMISNTYLPVWKLQDAVVYRFAAHGKGLRPVPRVAHPSHPSNRVQPIASDTPGPRVTPTPQPREHPLNAG